MRYAILSDLHANREALDRALDDAARQGAEAYVCLGDIVGYGPLPAETLARIREIRATCVAGNHDDAVSGRADASAFIDLAAEAVRRHRDALPAEALAWLRALPHTARVGQALAVHGDLTAPARFNYIEDAADAAATFAATDAQLVFTGHTHVPGLFLTGASGAVYRLAPQDFVLEDGKRYIVNPGSVGYPRETDGTCFSSYVLYDTRAQTVTFRRLPFAISSVLQRGLSPRRLGRRALTVLALLALLTGLCALWLRPAGTDPSLSAERVLSRQSLVLKPDQTAVRANLTLARSSEPALLTVLFRSADGGTLDRRSETVTKRAARKLNAPRGTRTAEFILTPLSTAGEVKIESFAPEAEPAGDAASRPPARG